MTSNLTPRIPLLSELFELTKPRVLALVMVTMACGALIAPGPPASWTLVLALFGTALVVGSATRLADGRFDVRYKLWDTVRGVPPVCV